MYGLGVTIGAGIYVLVGQTAAQAGMYAPLSFVFAATVMAFSAGTFAEFSGRSPQSAGEAIFVEAGFKSKVLGLLTGAVIILSAAIAAATIALGGAGYLLELINVPRPLVIVLIVGFMGLIASWGIKESVIFASVFTVFEILGLIVIVVAGVWVQPEIFARLPEIIPPAGDTVAMTAIFTTSLIAFFAFIGFDDVVNLVEETKNPTRNMPLAILITLVVATLLYFSVTTVAVMSIPLEDLAQSSAPISLLFERLTGISPFIITLVAIVATLNGIVIQIVMAARVLYGMAKKGKIPAVFATINSRTHTPVFSTVIITATVLALALFFPIVSLAELTTQLILVVFALVNASLVLLKIRKVAPPEGIFTVRIWVPIGGTISCVLLLLGPYLTQ